MVKSETARARSKKAVLANTKAHSQLINKIWSVADKSPMFSRVVRVGSDGKQRTFVRTSHMIGQHAFKIAIAGAVKTEMQKTQYALQKLGIKPLTEAPSSPTK